MSALMTAEQAAEHLSLPVDEFLRLRKQHGWPFVRFGKSGVRFTPEQVAEIIERQTVRREKGATPTPQRGALAGQTARSAKRGRR